jgi:hypothetical protein
MILRFISAHVLAFHLDALAQFPFPAVKNRLKLSPFDGASDLPHGQEMFVYRDEFSPGEHSF